MAEYRMYTVRSDRPLSLDELVTKAREAGPDKLRLREHPDCDAKRSGREVSLVLKLEPYSDAGL